MHMLSPCHSELAEGSEVVGWAEILRQAQDDRVGADDRVRRMMEWGRMTE